MKKEEREKRKSKLSLLIFLSIVVVGATSLLYAYLWFSWALNSPINDTPISLEVKKGETLKKVFQHLPQESIKMRRLPLTIYSRWKGIESKIHYGRYRIPANTSAKELLNILKEGRVLLVKATVPPGNTLKEVSRILERYQVVKAAEFLQFAQDPSKAKRVREKVFGREVGKGSLEGYLYPDTYYFTPDSDPFTVAFTMVENLSRHLPQDWQDRCKKLGLSLHQVITLASIVTKETYLPEEMPIIAAVFLKRLRLGMKLQADPTVIYAVEKETGSRVLRLRRRDLAVDSPYNTYMVTGLPPGPICSPSAQAIKAVLHPAKTNYLYFVAKGSGGHKFSNTLREHINAVNRYQRR